MFAAEKISFATEALVRNERQKKKIAEYIRNRLREELNARGRGAAALLARELKMSEAHVSNVTQAKTRGVGEDMRRKLAEHWGMTLAQLEATALGDIAPPPESDTMLVPRESGRKHFLDNADFDKEGVQARKFLTTREANLSFKDMESASPKKWAEEYAEAFRIWKRSQKSGDSPHGLGARVADEE